MELSPNKTLEGFIGGGLFTIIAGYYIPMFFRDDPYLVCTYDEYSRNISSHQCALAHEFQAHPFDLTSLIPNALKNVITIKLPSVDVVSCSWDSFCF